MLPQRIRIVGWEPEGTIHEICEFSGPQLNKNGYFSAPYTFVMTGFYKMLAEGTINKITIEEVPHEGTKH